MPDPWAAMVRLPNRQRYLRRAKGGKGLELVGGEARWRGSMGRIDGGLIRDDRLGVLPGFQAFRLSGQGAESRSRPVLVLNFSRHSHPWATALSE